MKRGSFLVVLIVVALCTFTAPANAVTLSCGQTITQDTTLDSDLVDCPGDGVVIGAPGITLDLGGHLIDGAGFGAGFQGVDDTAGHDAVTVTGGTVQEFFDGVRFVNGDGGTV